MSGAGSPACRSEPTRKGIAVTRSFGAAITFWTEMCEATASYAEKMRGYKVAADNLFVFMRTSTFNKDPFSFGRASARFAATTNYTGEVVALAVRLCERLWRNGFRYSKCGVMVSELLQGRCGNRPCGATWIGSAGSEPRRQWTSSIPRSGARTIRILSAGAKDAAWKLRAEHLSPPWTTRLDDCLASTFFRSPLRTWRKNRAAAQAPSRVCGKRQLTDDHELRLEMPERP